MRKINHKDWVEEGKRRFGDDYNNWKFVCPSCGFVQSVMDYKDVGAPSSAVAFSCVGRWRVDAMDAFTDSLGKGLKPCNYAGGGLIRLNPVVVVFDDGTEHEAFEFAEDK